MVSKFLSRSRCGVIVGMYLEIRRFRTSQKAVYLTKNLFCSRKDGILQTIEHGHFIGSCQKLLR